MADRDSEVTPSDLLQLRSWPAGPSWSERPQGFKLSWLSKGKRVRAYRAMEQLHKALRLLLFCKAFFIDYILYKL